MGDGVLIPLTMCWDVRLTLYLYLLVISLCDAEIHGRDRVPPYATTGIPCSTFPFPDHIYFDETSAYGSIIFVSNKTHSTKQEWNVRSSNPRIAMVLYDKHYKIILLTTVDLDVANPDDKCNFQLGQFVQRISCSRGTGLETVNKDVTFHVRPVNEHSPDVGILPEIQISEETDSVPLFLQRLFDYVHDRDCPKEHLVLSISEYSTTGIFKDASRYFMLNTSTGFLYQIKIFDYEDTDIQCNLGKGGGFLNITAEDGLHKTSRSLRVTFVDVDDSPPTFVLPGCTTTCYVCPRPSFDAGISYFNQATGDNGQTGNFTLLLSVVNTLSTKPNPTTTTIPSVTKQETNSSTMRNRTTIERPNASQTTSESTKDIIIIALTVLVVVLLMSACIVHAVYRIRIQRTKSEDKVTSYEEVKRNNDAKENEYATIQN